jgi:hypothetical protein
MAALACLTLAPLIGCVSNLNPLNVSAFLSLSPSATTCEVGTAQIMSGAMDTAYRAGAETPDGGSYAVGVQLISLLQPHIVQPDPAVPAADTNLAELTKLTTSYSYLADDGSAITLGDRVSSVSYTVPTGKPVTVGPVVLLTGTETDKLGGHPIGQLSVQLSFSGTLADGTSVSTTPAIFTIDVCNGCLPPPCCNTTDAGVTTCDPVLPCQDLSMQADAVYCPPG